MTLCKLILEMVKAESGQARLTNYKFLNIFLNAHDMTPKLDNNPFTFQTLSEINVKHVISQTIFRNDIN